MSLGNLRKIDQRLFYPVSDKSLAHCGFRLVKHPEECSSAFPVSHRLGQFEISSGGKVNFHKLIFRIKVNLPNIIKSRLLHLGQVVDRCAQSADRLVISLDAKLCQALFEMVGDDLTAVIDGNFFAVDLVGSTFDTVFDKLSDFIILNNGGIVADFARHISAKLVYNVVADGFGLKLSQADLAR